METITEDSADVNSSSLENEEGALRKRGIHKDIAATITAIIIFIMDQVGEIVVASHYLQSGHTTHFWLTSAFIVMPFVAMTVCSAAWYRHDRQKSYCNPVSTRRVWIRWVFHIFQMGLFLRYFDAIYFGFKTIKDVSNRKRYEHEERRAHSLKLIEAFLECVPQAITQIYIIITEATTKLDYEADILRALVITRLFLSMAVAMTLHHRARLCQDTGSRDISWWESIFYFLWYETSLTARIFSIALFATYVDVWVTAMVISAHWISMTLWVAWQRREQSVSWQKSLKSATIGFVHIFCYMKVRKPVSGTVPREEEPGSTQHTEDRKQIWMYVLVIFVESSSMVLMWYFQAPHIYVTNLYFILYWVSTFLGLLSMIAYYEIFSSSTRLLGNWKRIFALPSRSVNSSEHQIPLHREPLLTNDHLSDSDSSEDSCHSALSTVSAQSDDSMVLA